VKTHQTKERGAFGATEISFTPQTRRGLCFDVRNCPHCGVHHASLDAEVTEDRVTLRCPALGGAPLTLTIKLFLHRL